MQYEIEIRLLATIETIEAYDWYELQREGLGLEFLNELEKFYNLLLRNPKTHSYYNKPVRTGILNRFPYTIIYEVFSKTIVVYSVFMGKQNPLKKRII
ncbi:MAG: hypothetical protein ACR2KX_15050 [Chitinophagaceae bacterium]